MSIVVLVCPLAIGTETIQLLGALVFTFCSVDWVLSVGILDVSIQDEDFTVNFHCVLTSCIFLYCSLYVP